MADIAWQTAYREEFVAAFERRQSLLRPTVTTETIRKGNQVYFLVAGSGGATAVTRGVNGYIPARTNDKQQILVTLNEWHDLVRETRFNVFASQGDEKKIMQQSTMAVLNRKMDDIIIAALASATLTTGAAKPLSLNLVARILAILGNNNAGGPNITGVITPAAYADLTQIEEFTNVDYVDMKPLAATNEQIMAGFRWNMINWVVHTGLPGAGTASETMYFYNKAAVGHAIDTDGLMTPVGYDEEQDYSWARASADMGSSILQNSGIVKVLHDGSQYAAE